MDRRLAAILVADVQGFSKRMQNDEAGTINALVELRDEILSPKIMKHDGQLVTNAGDGAMAVFENCADAVRCAIDIQTTNEGEDLKVRIGINLGDITREGETVHGHGVNMASRIEALAAPGGIVIASSVRNAIQGQLNLEFKSLGRNKIKNIDEPIELFSINQTNLQIPPEINRALRQLLILGAAVTLLALIAIFGWRGEPATKNDPERYPDVAQSKEKFSIAVFPIKSLSTNHKDALWAEGLSRNIVTDLAKFNALFVVAADKSFPFMDEPDPIAAIRDQMGVRYVITGSLQRSDKDIRLAIAVVHTQSGRNAWSDSFDFTSENLLNVQSEIAAKIAQEIGPVEEGRGRLGADEYTRIARTETKDLVAFDIFLKGAEAELAGDTNRSREFFNAALALDPSYAKAQARLAWLSAVDYYEGKIGADVLSSAQDVATKALTLDPDEPEAHRSLGAILMFRGRHADGIRSMRQAVDLNPNVADNLMWLGWALSFTHETEESLYFVEKASGMRSNMPDWYKYNVGWANLMAGLQTAAPESDAHFRTCIDMLQSGLHNSTFSRLVLALCHARLGNNENASIAFAAFRDDEPEYTASMANKEPFEHREDLKQYLDMLRHLGLPE